MKYLLLVFLMTLQASGFAETFKVFDYNRYVELIGVVDETALDLADKINNISKKNNEEITMLINSPGGSVTTGMIVVDSMRQAKARGVKFKCLSTVLSASMAYIILAECNRRYVMKNTLLLWHEISLSVRGAKLRELMDSLPPLLALQDRVDMDLKRAMNVSDGFYNAHNKAETMWTGAELMKALNYNSFITEVNRAEVKTDNLYTYMKKSNFNFQIQFDSVRKILKRMQELN